MLHTAPHASPGFRPSLHRPSPPRASTQGQPGPVAFFAHRQPVEPDEGPEPLPPDEPPPQHVPQGHAV